MPDRLDQITAKYSQQVVRAIGSIDASDVAGGIRALIPALTKIRYQNRADVITHVTEQVRGVVADALGVDLGWQFLDESQYVSDFGKTLNAQRLSAFAGNAQSQPPSSALVEFRNRELILAGSEPHRLARIAGIDIAAGNPVASRYRRVAEAGACAFCRTLSTRGAVYYSPGTARASGHRYCRCTIRAGVDTKEALQVTRTAQQTYALSRGTTSAEFWKRAELAKPGALTVERKASVIAQREQYQQLLQDGRGTDWTRQRITDLTTELENLQAVT